MTTGTLGLKFPQISCWAVPNLLWMYELWVEGTGPILLRKCYGFQFWVQCVPKGLVHKFLTHFSWTSWIRNTCIFVWKAGLAQIRILGAEFQEFDLSVPLSTCLLAPMLRPLWSLTHAKSVSTRSWWLRQ